MIESQSDLTRSFIHFFDSRKIAVRERAFLIAISGGVDSVVLCELCRSCGMKFVLAHCNFQLRGEESERDEKFVRELAGRYGAEVFIRRFDTESYTHQAKISIQEAARKLRYEWFEEIRASQSIDYILLAHHADDNIETVMMNFFRGTGLRGLTGIPEENGNILRPMLEMRRKEIIAFAEQHNLSWVEDSTNRSSKYTRNFFRNELIPGISKAYPGMEDNLLHSIARFKKINSFYQSAVEKLVKEICERRGPELRIPIRKIKKYDYEVLIYEIIKQYGFSGKQVEEVIGLMESGSGKFIANGQYQVVKHGHWLIIAPVSTEAGMIPIEKEERLVEFSGGSLEMKLVQKEGFILQASDNIAQLDAKHIEFPLLLRRWKPGDYFYPLGMPKKKKVARFLIDKKLSKVRKENTWVIESNRKIIWVVGLRIDERYKIKDSTASILTLTYQDKLL